MPRLLALLASLFLLSLGPAAAQTSATLDLLTPADQSAGSDIASAEGRLAALTTELKSARLTDAEIKERQADIAALQSRLASDLADLGPKLADADTRLAQLGAAPAPDQPPEAPAAAILRRQLTSARAAIDAEVKSAKLMVVETVQLNRAASDRLRSNFAARVGTREKSMIDPTLWRDFIDQSPDDLRKLAGEGRDEGQRLLVAITAPVRAATLGFGLALAVLVLWPARLFLTRLTTRRVDDGGQATPLRRSGMAVSIVALTVLVPVTAGEILRLGLSSAGALTPSAEDVVTLAIRAVAFAALLEGLGRALIAPRRPSWRLAPMSDRMAKRLAPFPGLIGAAAALNTFVWGLNEALDTSFSSTLASQTLTVFVEMAVIAGTLAAVGRARAATFADAAASRPQGSHLPWVLAALAAWCALVGAFTAGLFGYLHLAGFLVRETVWVGVVLAAFVLAIRFTDALFPALFAPTSPVGRAVTSGLGLSFSGAEQIGVLLSGLARLIVIFVAWGAIASPFGGGGPNWAQRLTTSGLVFHVGKVAVSPGVIAGAIGLLILGVVATRAVRRWFERRYLPKTNLDLGLRASVASAVSYAGVFVTILGAFAYAGLSVSQIALLASALGVGIGFGLQAIISNFVSGLILLAERPIQVGDWISVGDQEGDVRRISIRATEIELQDHSKLLVPNSDLLTKAVRNITQGGALGRVRFVLRVEDDADPAAVRDLLLATLKAHPKVLKEPAPGVFMTDAKDGALEFTAQAYLASPRDAFGVKSDLLLAIFPALKAIEARVARTSTVVNVSVPAASPLAAQQGGQVNAGGDEAGEGQKHQEPPGRQPDPSGPGGTSPEPAEEQGHRQSGGCKAKRGGETH